MNLLKRLEMYLDPGRDDWSREELDKMAALLDYSGDRIVARRYPYGRSGCVVPSQYELLQVRMAADLFHFVSTDKPTRQQLDEAFTGGTRCSGMLDEVTPISV